MGMKERLIDPEKRMKFSTNLAALKETMLSIKQIKPGNMSHRASDHLTVRVHNKAVEFHCTGIDVTMIRKIKSTYIP